MAHNKPLTLAADLLLKAQTRQVRWMVHMIQKGPKDGESGMSAGIDGRIVTFHGRAGEAQLKAIIKGKDVVLYRWKRGRCDSFGIAPYGLKPTTPPSRPPIRKTQH